MKIKPSKKAGSVVIEAKTSDLASVGRPGSPIKLKRILVPVDFSDESKKALKYAVTFSREFKASLLFLHVVESVYYPAEMGYVPVDLAELERNLTKSAETKLRELVRTSAGRSHSAEILVEQGRTLQTIASVAKGRKIDLIIMASHGHTGLKHVLLGSTTERVVRHAPCPVLVVRQREHDFV
jgi:universal stress protein A